MERHIHEYTTRTTTWRFEQTRVKNNWSRRICVRYEGADVYCEENLTSIKESVAYVIEEINIEVEELMKVHDVNPRSSKLVVWLAILVK